MRKLYKIIAVLCCPILLLGCATIISGRSQKISINTTPPEAIIRINNMVLKSPAVAILDRTIPSYQVTIEKEGYEPTTYTIKRGLNGWVFGNIVFGGIIGVVIDCASGSVYAFSPSDIDINLVPSDKEALIIKTK